MKRIITLMLVIVMAVIGTTSISAVETRGPVKPCIHENNISCNDPRIEVSPDSTGCFYTITTYDTFVCSDCGIYFEEIVEISYLDTHDDVVVREYENGYAEMECTKCGRKYIREP